MMFALVVAMLVGSLILPAGGESNLAATWTTLGRPHGLTGGELRLGVDASYPPFAVAEMDGTLRGFEIDLAHEIARRLGTELRLTNTDVGGGLDALSANRFDGLLAGLSRAPELEDRVSFSRPYFDDGPRVVQLRTSAPGTLNGRRIGVELGSAADEVLWAQVRQGARLDVARFSDPAAVLEALHLSQIDVALLDATSARLAVARDGSLRVAPEPLASRPLALALRRSNRWLVQAVNQSLETMASDGALERLASRWLGA
jgi:ABC-type amino acid transport substrate-binding protein